MVITQAVDNSEMTEDQIYQLLREMEVVDEEGEFVWEENMDVEPNPICQDEFLQTNEGIGASEYLPDDIVLSFNEIKIQQVVNQDEVCTQKIKDDKIDTIEDENNKQIKCDQSKPVEKKSGKRWEPVVAEKKKAQD
jgi:hypothetical protein